MWILMKMLIALVEELIQLSELKPDNYTKFQKITGNPSRHYIFCDSLINSNYFFHYSPVRSPNS